MKKKALIVVNLAGFLHFLWNDIATLQEMGYEVSVAMNENSAAGPNLIEIPKLEEMGIAHYQVEFDTKSPVFVICGTAVVNSTIEEELKETASKLGVRIFLAGHRLDIPEINACADVAVIPSVREGFGMTGVEALASGVPVVGSDVQGIREYVIPGKTGYLCDPYDAHQFADAIEKIVNLPSEERAKMVIACKEKAKEFDVSKSIAAMKNIYQEVLCHDGK